MLYGPIKEYEVVKGLPKTSSKRVLKFRKSVSYKTFRRRMFAILPKICVRCLSENDLQLDHIKPICYYWSLRKSPMNIQILCSDCNCNFKKADYVTDYRSNKYKSEMRIKLGSKDIDDIVNWLFGS